MREERQAICPYCGEPFITTHWNKRFCSSYCTKAEWRASGKSEGLVTPEALAAEAIARWCYEVKREPIGLENCKRLKEHIQEAIISYHETQTGRAGKRAGAKKGS